eukprot:m.102258 g.102258  ORF g.102258 m.102258 type:complete len:527 (-) comp15006_c0_seq2:831-2411(-)
MPRLFFRRSRAEKKAGQDQAPALGYSAHDVRYQHLKEFREAQGLRAGTEYLIDWGDVRQRAVSMKDDFLQMRSADGSWFDVRVVLHSTYVSISRLVNEQSASDLLNRGRHIEQPRDVVIFKNPGEPLGISIKGGKEHRLPILLSQIKEGGPVDAAQTCFVGDELLEVDGVSLANVTQNEAIDIIHRCYKQTRVQLKVRFYLAAHHQLVSEYLRTSDPTVPMAKQQKWKEIVQIPLEYCHVSYYHDATDQRREQESFIIRAALDISKKAILRPPFGNVDIMLNWVRAIRNARDNYPCPPLAKANPPLDFTGRVVHIGRVHERKSDGSWIDRFLVLTDHDVGLYSAPPTTPIELDHPRTGCFPLLALRFVLGARKPHAADPLDAREKDGGCFSLKIAGGLQVYLCAGSREMTSRWKTMFEQRTDNAVRQAGSITYSAKHEWDVALTVNWQTGLWLNNDLVGDKSLIWHHPFAHLRQVEVTGPTSLRIAFAEGNETIQVENPDMILRVITAFMACHVRSREQFQVLSVA